MIKQIKINNFQSHKESILNFKKGINIILGSSNSGKTAILRSLYWVLENRPSGIGFVNKDIVNEKNKLTGEVSVEIETEKGKVKRLKNKNDNKYEVNGEVFEALGMKIPEQVIKFFNFTDVNLQKQLDKPFLLAETSGEIARYFNKIVKLDKIDRVLSAVERDKRKVKSEISYIEDEKKKIKEDLKGYEWIKEAEKLLLEYEENERKLEKIKENLKLYTEIRESYIYYSEKLKKLETIEEKTKIVDEYSEILEKKEKITEKIQDLKKILLKLDKINLFLKKSDKIELVNKFIKKFENIEDNINKITGKIDEYGQLIFRIRKVEDYIEEYNKELKEVLKNYPEVCPLCGQPIKKVEV